MRSHDQNGIRLKNARNTLLGGISILNSVVSRNENTHFYKKMTIGQSQWKDMQENFGEISWRLLNDQKRIKTSVEGVH